MASHARLGVCQPIERCGTSGVVSDRPAELDRLRRERRLMESLLSLGRVEAFDSLLEDALGWAAEIAGAERAYLVLRDSTGRDREWSRSLGCDAEGLGRIQGGISTGIVAEALSTGETIVTNSAVLDQRFRGRDSVRSAKIEAVVCAPIGGDVARGVVYLEGRRGGGPFSDEDRDLVGLFATGLAPFADRLLVRRRLAESVDPTHGLRQRFALEGVIGRSAALAAALDQAMMAAPLDVVVLLTGPSGSGKGVLARAIHRNSRRKDGPFVELNCAAIQPTLLEAELFGARAGSHSTAQHDRSGQVAAAEGGTLFLDEIAEIPFEAQAKLLQLLQDRRYYALGATEATQADLRILVATNADLQDRVATKQFREDLYYRINVLPVHLPALADRPEDLVPLAVALLERAIREHGLPPMRLSQSALLAIETAAWPGNVRELYNAVQAAAIRAVAGGASEVGAAHLFVQGDATGRGGELTFQEATRRFQRELVQKTLEDVDWNVRAAAKRLDIARSYMYKLIGSLGPFHRPD